MVNKNGEVMIRHWSATSIKPPKTFVDEIFAEGDMILPRKAKHKFVTKSDITFLTLKILYIFIISVYTLT